MTSRVAFTIAVLVLLALPAAVLAQGGVEAGWTDSPPTLDGDKTAGEWAAATRVALTTLNASEATDFALPELDPLGLLPDAAIEGEVSPSQTTGWLYLMNDARNLYLAVTLDVGAPAGWPDSASTGWVLFFEDEPVIGDGLWAADLCAEDPDEGQFASVHSHSPQAQFDVDTFVPVAEEDPCHGAAVQSPPGYQRALGYGPLTIETRIHLTNSALQAVPGECVNLGLVLSSVEVHGEGQWFGVGLWPADLVGATMTEFPDVLAEVCLAEEPVVEEEEFVPELGSLALLGSGLMGLAGYAGLRWRSRRDS
jgi:hypothetical protein